MNPKLRSAAKDANAAGAAAVKLMIDRFRSGLWTANGQTGSQVCAHENIPRNLWFQSGVNVSFCDDLMSDIGHAQYTNVRVLPVRLERRVEADTKLQDAIDAMVDASDIPDMKAARSGSVYSFRGVLVIGVPMSQDDINGDRRFFWLRRYDELLKGYLTDCLLSGALRLKIWRSVDDKGYWLEPCKLGLGNLDFVNSTFEMPGQPPVAVRIHPGDHLLIPAPGIEAVVGSVSSYKRGRPSRAPEILAAWRLLVDANRIDRYAPLKEAIDKVRQEVIRASRSDDERGLGHEAIRKRISKEFYELKRGGDRPETINSA